MVSADVERVFEPVKQVGAPLNIGIPDFDQEPQGTEKSTPNFKR